jgi:hypothetical protein
LTSHKLADFQRIEKLPSWRELGDQKFSVLLASILEPASTHSHELNKFFLFLFLQHLLAKLSIPLSNDEEADPRELAVKADSNQEDGIGPFSQSTTANSS